MAEKEEVKHHELTSATDPEEDTEDVDPPLNRLVPDQLDLDERDEGQTRREDPVAVAREAVLKQEPQFLHLGVVDLVETLPEIPQEGGGEDMPDDDEPELQGAPEHGRGKEIGHR